MRNASFIEKKDRLCLCVSRSAGHACSLLFILFTILNDFQKRIVGAEGAAITMTLKILILKGRSCIKFVTAVQTLYRTLTQ
jgi:hypothetical protein